MIAWERVAVPSVLCGGCGRALTKGDPILVFTVERYPRGRLRRIRCDRCEGPAPPDLPALVDPPPITPTPLTRFAPMLPLGTPLADFRARQSGDDREPGEDG